jgi:hypothetical protein
MILPHCLRVCESPPPYQLLNAWTNIYETYIYHGTWDHINGVLHKSLPPVWVCMWIFLLLVFLSGLFPSSFPTNILHELLLWAIHATCPVHLILLDLVSLIILDEEYKFWSPTLCSFLQPPASSSLHGSKYPPQYPVFRHSQSMFYP